MTVRVTVVIPTHDHGLAHLAYSGTGSAPPDARPSSQERYADSIAERSSHSGGADASRSEMVAVSIGQVISSSGSAQ
jgi:hypothetical protein